MKYDVAIGSIEGIVAKCCIGWCVIETDTYGPVVCTFADASTSKGAWDSGGSRVMLSGELIYVDGKPVHLIANAVRVFPPEDQLPRLEDIQAIYRELKT